MQDTDAEKMTSLGEILPKTMESMQRLGRRISEKEMGMIFFATLKNARMIRLNGAKTGRVVVLARSKEEISAAIDEGFPLALKEYFWTAKNKKSFRGFQFFVKTPEEAEEIRRIIPSRGKIPKKDSCRVNFCTMPQNTDLRWLARRFIEQKFPVP